MPRLTRRKRLVVLTSVAAGIVVMIVGGFVWAALRPEPTYRPGEPIDGLTAALARNIPEDYPATATFRDVTESAGIRFHHFGGVRSSQLPEDMGSGAAWGDYDNDGWLDLFLVNIAGPLSPAGIPARDGPARSALYRNRGDGTFEDVTERAGVGLRTLGMAAAWADYDGDEALDLVVTSYGHLTLLRNLKNGAFADVSAAAGLAAFQGFWTGASWADFDRDGDLDLYVTGYVRYAPVTGAAATLQYDVEVPVNLNPSAFPPERNLLFRNEGNGMFTEVAAQAGVLGEQGRSLAAAWTDLDDDGWPDLYVANDVSDNVLYRNRGNGTFEDVSHAARVADYRGAMGIATGDWDNDGDVDLFITHWIAQENALYRSLLREFQSRPSPPSNLLQFMDEADRFGLGQSSLDFIGWGAFFFDFDNDGRQDLFVANGSTFQNAELPERLAPMRAQLFWNRGPDDGFYDVSAAGGEYFVQEYVGRGAAYADYDNDGDLDVVIVHHGGPAILLRNDGGDRGAWLAVALEGRRSNWQGIGAKLRVRAGNLELWREVGAQSSYLSQNSPVVHLGLGPVEQVDTLEIRWPSGVRQVVTGVRARQRITVVEGTPSSARERVQAFWTHFRRATAHRMGGEWERAAAEYEAALALQPGHEDALYYLGNTRFELGDYAAAEAAWRRLADQHASAARAHSQLGMLYACPDREQWFRPAAAAAALERAASINREETGPLARLGQLRVLEENYAAAERVLESVVATNPRSVEAHFFRGYLRWRRGELDAARAELRAAIQAAQPPEPVRGVLGEGDRKPADAGWRPAAGCPSLDRLLEPLIAMDTSTVASAVDSVYGAFRARFP